MTKRKQSEGALQLGRLGRTDDELAVRLECKREQVSYWKNGVRIPAPASRAKLFRVLKIPIDAWDQYPRGSSQAAAIGGVVASTPIDYEVWAGDDGSVSAKAKRLDRLVRSMLDVLEAEKAHDDSTPREAKLHTLEQFRLATDAHALLDKIGKLTGETQQIPESRIVRLPAMRRILDRCVGALKPYPAALAAFSEALRELGGEV